MSSREFLRLRSGLGSELRLKGLDGVVEVCVRSSGPEFWEGGGHAQMHVHLPDHVGAGVSSFSLVMNSLFLLLKAAGIGRWTPHLVD